MKTGIGKVDGRGRPSEDRSFIRELPGGILVAGVFDGHSGLFTVNFTLNFLPVALAELVQRVNPDDEGVMRSGMRNVFIEHDKKLAKQGALSYRDSGSTCTVAVITCKKVYMAYLGDSPACVFHPKTGEIYGSIDKHDPSGTVERARIYRNGGNVTTDPGDAPRVNGCLMVSRAFGDFSMKFKNGNKPTEQEWAADWTTDFCVVADPDIVVIPRPVGGGLMAMYSDGLVETPDGDHYKDYPQIVKEIMGAYGSDSSLEECAKTCIQAQVSSFVADPKEYNGDDITLVLIQLPALTVTAPVIGGGAGQTRRHRVGHRRTRSNKKRLAKSFYI